jgi:L-ascorbate metabolism protein UlaG (beta-lactamase superfamily)
LDQGSIFFIGNATVLIRVAGFTLLTDPSFIHMHEETWLGNGLQIKRLTNPAMEIGDLPPLDFVLVSHFHGDHFDQAVERELDHTLPIVTTSESAAALAEQGFTRCVPLETWESLDIEKGPAWLRITAAPPRHGPVIVDFALPDVIGSMLDVSAPNGGRARPYISGDTLRNDELKEIPQGYSDIDIALLHPGGTRVMGVLVRMDAEQGVAAMRIVDPALAIPFITTTTTSSPPRSPTSRRRSAPPVSRTGFTTCITAKPTRSRCEESQERTAISTIRSLTPTGTRLGS